MVPKLTMDGGLLRENVLQPAVKTLKTWAAEGKIEIFESDRAKEVRTLNPGWPGGPPPQKPQPRFRATKRADSGGASFQQISAVLFPQRDPNRLNMTEVNDVAHLLRHQFLGHTIFVTVNAQNFIVEGKRERLRTVFKILVLTPEETVLALEESEGWETSKKKKGDQ